MSAYQYGYLAHFLLLDDVEYFATFNFHYFIPILVQHRLVLMIFILVLGSRTAVISDSRHLNKLRMQIWEPQSRPD